MKKYMAVWGSLFFFVLCCSLYLMLETLTLNPGRSVAVDGNNLNGIDLKILKIEQDVVRNGEIVREIKETIKKMANGNANAFHRLQDVLESDDNPNPKRFDPVFTDIALQSPRKSLPISKDMCAAAEYPSAKTDVQMLNAFKLIPFDNADGGTWKQGYELTYKMDQWDDKKLKVFVVPHSHNDPGWLKTFEVYYKQETKLIFENMVDKLEADSRRRFIYAEISFFSLWWDEIDDSKKERVKKLIHNGQLEIVTGGWVMTDEADAHYFAMVDQLLEGHQWLLGTLGVKPRSGWAIDPFGHSPTMAYILKRSGLQSMLVQRIHYAVKKYLAQTKQLEFEWRQDWDQSGSTDILCHMMPFYSYDIPHTCGPDPKVCCQFDFKRLAGGNIRCPWKIPPVAITDGNVVERAHTLLDQYRKKAQLYRSNVLLIPLGDDFRYQKPEEWDNQFNNYFKLFDYMNANADMHVEAKFGTLSEYFDAVFEDQGVKPGDKLPEFPVLSGDFFSYSDRDDDYWTGYFTSRPFYKNLDRIAEYHLRAGEVIFSQALAHARQETISSFPSHELMMLVVKARRNLALYQHHDGITGTAKDFVVVDYGQRILEAINGMKTVITESSTLLMLPSRLKYKYNLNDPVFLTDESRTSHDAIPEKTVIVLSEESRAVLFYNSLAHQREQMVKIYVNVPHVEVRDAEGNAVPSQTDPFWINNENMADVVFKVSFIAVAPALGISKYYINRSDEKKDAKNRLSTVTLYNSEANGEQQRTDFVVKRKSAVDFKIENNYLQASFSGTTGLLKSVTTKVNGVEHAASVDFATYGTVNAKQKSGAYLFIPDGPAKPLNVGTPYIRVIRGPLISEVHVFVPHVEHVVRLMNSPGTDGVAVDVFNIVDIRKEINQELAMRISTDIKNGNEFHTDMNGFQIQKRRRLDKFPLQANFYPMPTMMFIEDNIKRFSILTAQSLGTSSLKEGQVEVMLDRRMNQDDFRGLVQPMNDNKRTPNRFRLLIEIKNKETKTESDKPSYPSLMAHLASSHLIHPLYILPHSRVKSSDSDLRTAYSPLANDMPCELHLLNLRTMQNKDDSPELRFIPRNSTGLLLHRISYDCSFPNAGLLCKPGDGKVNLGELFKDIKIENILPTSLTLIHDEKEVSSSEPVQIQPMEIASYKVVLH